jgi:hypothetical protein
MTSDQTPESAAFFGFMKSVAEASVLLGAGLFLIGWSYLYGYYRGFGLSADNLNLSVYSVLIRSIPVIVNWEFYATSIAVVLVLLIAGSFQAGAGVLRNPASIVLLLIVAGLSASRYATGVGRDHALRDASLSTSTLPYVTLEGAEESSATGCALTDSNYRLLVHANGQVVVLLPVDVTQKLIAPNMRVCIFQESRIQAMRIQVGLPEVQ